MSLYREAGDGERVAACLGMLGNIAGERHDYPIARQRYGEALQICRDDGNRRGVATHLNNLGTVAWGQRDLDGARAMFDEAAEVLRGLGDMNSRSIALLNLAGIATTQGDLAATRTYLSDGLKIVQDLGSMRPGRMALEVASGLAEARGEAGRAATLRGAADALREALGMPFSSSERHLQEGAMTRLRQALGDGGFEQAWGAGRSLAPEEALAHAAAWLEGAAPAIEPTSAS